MITLCETWGVNYGRIARWVHADAERDKAYKQALADRNEYRLEAILREIQYLGQVDVRKAFRDDGTLKPLKDMPEEVAKCIASLTVKEFQGIVTTRVNFWDKLKALELAGKNLGAYVDKVEITHKKTLEVLLSEVVASEVVEAEVVEAKQIGVGGDVAPS